MVNFASRSKGSLHIWGLGATGRGGGILVLVEIFLQGEGRKEFVQALEIGSRDEE